MAVKLREKTLSNGLVSFYLDIYHEKKRWYEFLNIHINRKKATDEDKEKKRLAGEIRAKREHELIVNENGLIDKKRKQADFVQFFVEYVNSKKRNHRYLSTLCQLRKFTNGTLPINNVTTEWMKAFERFLLESVSNNTALCYLMDINGALNQLVRKQILARNPWHSVPKHERMKKKDVMRTAWTLEQLQKLVDTPCNIEPQFKEAYLFACFTGLRWSDVNGLMWSNIIKKKTDKKEEWFLNFEQQKTDTIEYFPLSEQAFEILKNREKINGNNIYVFPSVKEIDPRTSRTHSNVNYALRKWAKAAGLDERKMKFHTGRHTYATNVLELTNGDLYTVSKLLGHKSIKTTEIYAHVRDRMKYAAVKSLPLLKFNQS